MKMSRRTFYLLFALIFSILASVRAHHSSNTEAVPHGGAMSQITTGAPTVDPVTSPATEQTSRHVERLASIERLIPPSVENLREEAAADPHSTPRSLIVFAESIGKLMPEAKTDTGSARALFDKLADCASSNDGATNVQAVCLANAERLAGNQPALLARDYERLQEKTPREVALLLKQLKF